MHNRQVKKAWRAESRAESRLAGRKLESKRAESRLTKYMSFNRPGSSLSTSSKIEKHRLSSTVPEVVLEDSENQEAEDDGTVSYYTAVRLNTSPTPSTVDRFRLGYHVVNIQPHGQ